MLGGGKSSRDKDRLTLSRRAFLGSAGVTGVLVCLDPAKAAELGAELPTHRVRVRRDLDLVDLEISFVNFQMRGYELAALGSGRSLVIVRFGPQNLAEAVFDKPAADAKFDIAPLPVPPAAAASANSPVPPVRSFLSGPSWVVFTGPDGFALPFRRPPGSSLGGGSLVDSWLRVMSDWPIRIPRGAHTPGEPAMPRYDETCLEIPFRVFIAPTSSQTRWLTSSAQLRGLDVRSAARHELWHAALLSRLPLTPALLPPGVTKVTAELEPPERITLQARAVFSPDYSPDQTPATGQYYPGKMQLSLESLTRHSLVKQQMVERNGWIDAEHLVLTSLGSNASLSYMSQVGFQTIIEKQLANDPAANDPKLAIWKHRIVIGRDVFFVEAYFGFLLPCGYPALAVSVTRREFVSRYLNDDQGPFGPPGAYLLKERFILIQDSVKQFTDSGSVLGRLMPFKKVVATDHRSPPLADWSKYNVVNDLVEPGDEGSIKKLGLDEKDINKIKNGLFFVPRLLGDGNGTPAEVRWSILLEDESGRQSKTSDACFLFAQNIVWGQKLWQVLSDKFRRWSVPAQPMAFAPEKAELAVLADQDTLASGGKVISGQVLARHTLEAAEHAAARQLGQGIRDWVSTKSQLAEQAAADLTKQFEDLQKMPGRALDRLAIGFQIEATNLQGLKEQTAGQILELAGRIRAEINDKKTAFEDLFAQLERAEQVSATLETHALVFDCQPVKELFDQVQNELIPLARQAKTVEEFIGQVNNPGNKLPQKLKDRIVSDVKARLDPLAQDAAAFRQELQAYVGELVRARQDAIKIGNEFFQTQLKQAEVVIPALKAMAADSPVRVIQHLDDYLAKGVGELGQGFSRVHNGVFARLTETIDQGKAMADQIRCGVARPGAIIAGLSRDLGAVMGKGEDAVKDFARQFEGFKGEKLQQLKDAIPDSKLFGVLPLRDLVAALSRGQVPSINLVNLPDRYEHVWTWTLPIDKAGKELGFLKLLIEAHDNKSGNAKPHDKPVCLHIQSLTRIERPAAASLQQASADPASLAPRGRVELSGYLGLWDELGKKPALPAQLTDQAFAIRILSLVEVGFRQVHFAAVAPLGQVPKPQLKPEISGVRFLGPLRFLMELQEKLLGGLLGDNFKLDVTPAGIAARFAFQLPAISIAVVSIRNLSVGTRLELPFQERPLRLDFNFSTFQEPAEITVMCFGGRAFFRAAFLSDGNRELEGALEFGGALSFDVFVAKGSLYVMAGIYFRITNSTTELAGYLRAGGTLSVLGLIHASIEFLLMVRYRSERIGDGSLPDKVRVSNQLYGVCTITVSIDLFLFSINVSIKLEKKIAGSESDEPANGQGAFLDRGDRYFVAHLAQGAAAKPLAPEIPQAYFTRPAAGPKPIAGRWKSTDDWNKEYWSQF